ncbi:hypothetical protein CHH69_16960 [Terribacillus saccharophilus]|uniref:hypothetical protein n=1 Tax=Terribacillus saccharophilus TaxID=361277 RepID=UPI000BA5E693|nr:hypothetical protein [Terribacillus saccharophilus]PAF34220.1 hypothetical protein CHH69_16960 [Terribacillus saccharophilus]
MAAHHLQVYDNDLIFSWTPREFRLKIKGSQHRQIDEYERDAQAAIFGRVANNQKKVRQTQLFNADKARKRLDKGFKDWRKARDVVSLEQHRRAKAAMKEYFKTANKEGG